MLFAALAALTELYAAPVGNSSAPGVIKEGMFFSCDRWIDFRVGYEGDFVADGRMEQKNQGTGRVDTYEQWTNSGTFTLNVLDRLDLYGVFGSSRTEADWRFEDAASGNIHRIKLKTGNQFSWAAAGRAILYEWCNTCLGAGGRYTSCNNRPDQLTSDGMIADVANSQFFWREWQVNLDVSYKISLFIPYIGIKYSKAQARLKNFGVPISASLTGNHSFKNRIQTGLYLGCTLSNGKYFMLNLEGRLIDEEAVTVSGDFRF